jgi:hypothetical protein
MIFLKKAILLRRIIHVNLANQKFNLSTMNTSHKAKLDTFKIPAFKVDSKHIYVITEPTEFHSKLLVSNYEM